MILNYKKGSEAQTLRKLLQNNKVQFCAFVFLLLFLGTAWVQGLNLFSLQSDFIGRVGMNGILALAMIPAVVCGIGLNFGLSIGMLCGLLGGCISIELNLHGAFALLVAFAVGSLFATIGGILYGMLLNRLKGSEMTVGTYAGFSAVSLMSVAWTLLPFSSPAMVWNIGGKGLRTTISLTDHFGGVLNHWGQLLLLAILSFAFFLFLKTRTGLAMKIAGEQEPFARSCGIDVDKMRILGTTISTILGAIGILVYAQGCGFMQLYQAPLMMPFLAVAAVLLGGATIKHGKVRHALLGVCLLQLLMTVSTPVMSHLFPNSNSSDAIRIIITYGMILYALTQKGGIER